MWGDFRARWKTDRLDVAAGVASLKTLVQIRNGIPKVKCGGFRSVERDYVAKTAALLRKE
jgi:hypothetical protein